MKFGPISTAYDHMETLTVLSALRERHTGGAQAVPLSRLAWELGLADDGQHTRLRRTLADALEKGMPIGASGRGYFWIENDDERTENIRVLQSRISHITARVQALQRVEL